MYQNTIVDRLIGLYDHAHACAAATGIPYPTLIEYRRKKFIPARLADKIEEVSKGVITASDVRQAAMNR